jgi:hypothetical protein
MPDSKGPPVTKFTCSICGETMDYGTPHTCLLTAKDKEKLARNQRSTHAARAAALREAATCQFCRQRYELGRGHACPAGSGDKALDQARESAWKATLKSAGFDVIRRK